MAWCSSSFADVLSQFAMRAPLELRQGTQSSSHVLVVPPVEMQQGAWGPFELWWANLGFLSSCTWEVRPPLELRQPTQCPPQVAVGNWRFLSSGNRVPRAPVVLQLGTWVSS